MFRLFKKPAPTSLLSTPVDTLVAISSFLSIQELQALSHTSREINSILSERRIEEQMWQVHFERYFPNADKPSVSYKKEFKRKYQELLFELYVNGKSLAHTSPAVQDDRAIVHIILNKNGMALSFASERLKNDSRLVDRAVARSHSPLQFASNALRSKPDFMLTQIEKSHHAIRYATNALKHNREFILSSVKKNGLVLQYLPMRYKLNEEIALEAIAQNPQAYHHIPQRLQSNSNIQFSFNYPLLNTALGYSLAFAETLFRGIFTIAKHLPAPPPSPNNLNVSLFYDSNYTDINEDSEPSLSR